MEMIIKKWGNSLAARIPMPIAKATGITVDQKITIEANNGKIIITPVVDDIVYKLDDLLKNCPEKAVKLDDEDQAWLNDEPVGKEW
ncbi:MAG: AbrB family transcriptional regulator [Desulfobacteraceae bacterium 4572_89]|nr:MAG: AbrB family transcriptional regulator [Desulfobacteraceae bacterium 4572_89]